jgi:hypothetical protein
MDPAWASGSRLGVELSCEHLDGGRLSGAVGAEKPEDLAAIDREVDAANGFDVAVSEAEP